MMRGLIKYRTRFTVVLLLLTVMKIEAQDTNSLVKIQQEIRRLETELKQNEAREQTVLEKLEGIDRQIGLQKKLVDELETHRKSQERNVNSSEGRLRKATESYNRLKVIVAQRMVNIYKRGRMADWAVLFSAGSLNKVAVWLRYKQRIVENDRRNLVLLEEKRSEISASRDVLRRELNEKDRLIRLKSAEAEKLMSQKEEQGGMLRQVRNDRASIQEQLREKRIAYQEIQGRINRAEEQRKLSTEQVGDTKFEATKGRLTWPVPGEIVTQYGNQRHPTLRTTTENLGVDIQAEAMEGVKAVHRGEVRWVTWQRGMGNIVLVDHGLGYYTVYAHLDVVLVEMGDRVTSSQVIGYVGDESSLYGSTLHFEVWKGTTHNNPETWLR